MSVNSRERQPRLARISTAFLICGLLGAEFALGQADIEVARTTLERSSNDQLERDAIDMLDGSHWQLTKTEWKRVEALQSGFRQYISDRQISPLEILGIHARSDVERDRYARRWARLMIEDAERVLAFQRAYDNAVRDLVGEQPLIDLSQLPASVSSVPEFLPTDRLAVFVRIDCPVCNEALRRVFALGRKMDGVDVYVLGLADDDKSALHAWANRQGIPPMAVHAKRITLNFDGGLLARVHPRADAVPVVMRRRDDQFEPVDPWEVR